MHIVSISDVHIKDPLGENAKLFIKFLQTTEVLAASHIVLLGDIFDLLVGNKKQYLKKYENILSELKRVSKDKKLLFFSGNHDFSVKNILCEFFKGIDFEYHANPYTLKYEDQSIYLSHGDELDVEDMAYIRWKRIYSHPNFQKMIDNFLPYKLIDFIGTNGSKKSRSKGQKTFDYNKAENKYKKSVERFLESNNHDFYILGHTHIEYLATNVANNGYFPIHKKFVSYSNKTLKLISL